ncbi:MAG TPA: N-acetylmuramic acid 6-phosphate etherase, partial [Deinococcales bacterium]|nr:N-acetylmuramic acid 6-phosphate etherase [Deinococcales bacterium]
MSDYLPATETFSETTTNLDLLGTPDLVRALAVEHEAAVRAVLAAGPAVAAAVDAIAATLEAGGRLVYIGAGTSGRL